MTEKLAKGYATEEILRNYFITLGFYVLRGVKFKYNNFDVTDVDLLLFSKSSPLKRERINVDIKNKRTPQAIERIFWAKGLQQTLNLDSCMVVTSENRSDVMEFGLKHDVNVLDGKFLSRLSNSNKSNIERISEEQLFSLLDESSHGKVGGDWKGRLDRAKARLINKINFDNCNAYLNDIKYFFSAVSEIDNKSKESAALWRAIYCVVSYFAISLDFILSDYQTLDQEQRRKLLDDGFRFGSAGREFTNRVTSLVSALATSTIMDGAITNNLASEIHKMSESIKSDLLGEFFSKVGMNTYLFECAREMETLAYKKEVLPPSSLSNTSQSIIAILCDFNGFDRKKIIF